MPSVHLGYSLIACFLLEGVNECSLGTDNCDLNSRCIDLEEGFRCICNTGFTGDGSTCQGNIYFYPICVFYRNILTQQ